MIDEGLATLTDVKAFGIFHHGYLTTNGFFSRHGIAKPMPEYQYSLSSAGFYGYTGVTDEWLVDFGMPEIETPQDEIDVGLSRWNKLILRGPQKDIWTADAEGRGIKVGSVGRGGWLYRSPDGSVFKLVGARSGGAVVVNCSRGALSTGGSVAASIAVGLPADTGFESFFITTTFAPDGKKAALNLGLSINNVQSPHFAGMGYGEWTYAVVEASLSGGSKTALPTITLSVTYADFEAMTITNIYHEVSNGVDVAGSGAAGLTEYGMAAISPYHTPAYQTDPPYVIWRGSAKERKHVRLVDFDHLGNRVELIQHIWWVGGSWIGGGDEYFDEHIVFQAGDNQLDLRVGGVWHDGWWGNQYYPGVGGGMRPPEEWVWVPKVWHVQFGRGFYPKGWGSGADDLENILMWPLLKGRSVWVVNTNSLGSSVVAYGKVSALGAADLLTDGATALDCGIRRIDEEFAVTFNPDGGGYTPGVLAYF